MKCMNTTIVALLFLTVVPLVYADNQMPLLAVSETPDGYKGSTANLYLEIKPGTGKVFIETFPLSKLDTQISTRFAKDIACNFLDVDCENYDFFYTIRADSPIVGGPSAGAASTILTISALKNFKLYDKVAITGTINSGGQIGPVGNVKEKIDAAAEKKLTRVLIASGSAIISVDNQTINLTEYGKKKGIEVIEVFDLDAAVYYFSGKHFEENNKDLVIDKKYLQVMQQLSVMLCNRSNNFRSTVERYDLGMVNAKNISLFRKEKNDADNLTQDAQRFYSEQNYYSAASFCFGANVKYRHISLLVEDPSRTEIIRKADQLQQEISDFSNKVDNRKIETLTDLQTYMIVKERLIDSEEYVTRVKENVNDSDAAVSDLSYAIERLYSAYSWSKFFGEGKEKFDMNKEALRKSCIDKISEAQERYNYATLYFPAGLENIKDGINSANKDLINNDHELCLFKASKAKAEADLILSAIGLEKSQVGNIVEKKLELAKRVIIKESDKGAFPILGYSYYEYANSLKNKEPYSAMLYSEYALELSNLDIYFEHERGRVYFPDASLLYMNRGVILVFIGGIIVGVVFAVAFISIQSATKSDKKKISQKAKIKLKKH